MKKKTVITLLISSLVALLLTSSCVNIKKATLIQEKGVSGMPGDIENTWAANYVINTGDQLYIKVYSNDEKTSKYFQSDFPEYISPTYLYLNSYEVDLDGYIHFSFIEKVKAQGLTLIQLNNKIQEELDKYFKQTKVVIKLSNFEVSVLGEVNKPGQYRTDLQQLTIFQAIGMAGGTNMYGKLDKVKLVRKTSSGVHVEYLDLTDNAILQSEYYYMNPNDVIYIEPRSAKVFALDKFPYGAILSVLAIGVSVLSISQK